MINPKQQLTLIRDIYLTKENPAILEAARASGDFAADMADADAVHENEVSQFAVLQDRFSISTVQEVAELARRDQEEGSTFLEDAGLSPDIGQRLLQLVLNSPDGADEVQDWDRFNSLEYATGCDIDFSIEPSLTIQPPVTGPAAAFGATSPAPTASVSLIGPHMPPIRDQGFRGTCVAFTAMACLEFHQSRFGIQTGLDLSEQFTYWDMVTKTGQRNLVSAYPLLPMSGSCLEATWPYYPKDMPGNDRQDPPPPTAMTEAPAYRCVRVHQVPARDIDAIKSELTNERAVGIGIPVYKSWKNSGVVRKYGNITVPLPGEVPEPIGHAVALVGFSDDPQFAGGGYFVVRNSWGMNWATVSAFGVGYGTIPYRYVSNYNWDAWTILA